MLLLLLCQAEVKIKGSREGGREGAREGGKEGGREGGREVKDNKTRRDGASE